MIALALALLYAAVGALVVATETAEAWRHPERGALRETPQWLLVLVVGIALAAVCWPALALAGYIESLVRRITGGAP